MACWNWSNNFVLGKFSDFGGDGDRVLTGRERAERHSMKAFTGSVEDGLALLLSTEDDFMRNHLAMDLAETGDVRVKDALIALIQRPELRNNRGTLVYALENYDCRDQALFLLELIRSGNFEVAGQATIIVKETVGFPADHVTLLLAELKKVAKTATEDWRHDFALCLLRALRK